MLPVHGGWLDRINSSLFALPVVFILVTSLRCDTLFPLTPAVFGNTISLISLLQRPIRKIMMNRGLSRILIASLTWVASSNAAPPKIGPHLRNSSYWSTAEGQQSTVHLHNNLVKFPITVTPILYLDDGSAMELTPITLGPLANSELDINNAASEKGLPSNSRQPGLPLQRDWQFVVCRNFHHSSTI